jgi:hypothetical protein
MTYQGRVKNRVIIFDAPVQLPEGLAVAGHVVGPTEVKTTEGVIPTILERLGSLVGAAEGLPPGLAENHDHYLHGLPKR